MINGAFTAKLAFEQAELVKNERLAGKSRMKRQKIVNRPRRAVEAGEGDMRQISALVRRGPGGLTGRSEEHTYELKSLMRNYYVGFCLKKKKTLLQDRTNLSTTSR